MLFLTESDISNRHGVRGIVRLVRATPGLHISLHSLRHTSATLKLEDGCDLFALSTMMGRGQIRTIPIYLAATPEQAVAVSVTWTL